MQLGVNCLTIRPHKSDSVMIDSYLKGSVQEDSHDSRLVLPRQLGLCINDRHQSGTEEWQAPDEHVIGPPRRASLAVRFMKRSVNVDCCIYDLAIDCYGMLSRARNIS